MCNSNALITHNFFDGHYKGQSVLAGNSS